MRRIAQTLPSLDAISPPKSQTQCVATQRSPGQSEPLEPAPCSDQYDTVPDERAARRQLRNLLEQVHVQPWDERLD